MKLDDQLKAAIVKMPVKEKDKLLLRLVAKDRKLVRRLVFELIEGGSTIDERVSRLKKDIHDDLFKLAVDHATPGLLLVFYRHWNARITEHVHATKDKLGKSAWFFICLPRVCEFTIRCCHLFLNEGAIPWRPILYKEQKL
ncbi:MAG: hypothetical protein R2778_17880 [Saprospiraceae bacterium]